MRIANNILRHSLRNVYFLIGTACGGKTTMAKALSEKYGFVHFDDNWHEPPYKMWETVRDLKYQKSAREVTDWEAYFGRPLEEFVADMEENAGVNEFFEFAVVELVKMSQHNTIVADIGAPADVVLDISDYHRVACLRAPAELIVRDYYGREDHREFIECIMRLTEPEKKLATQNELFRIGAERIADEARECGMFQIVRNEESTVEKTLRLLEAHFKL